jgi:hypothetical protein
MAIQIQGYSGLVQEVDGANHRALKVTTRPIDHGTNGAYKMSGTSGTIGAGLAAGSEVFQFRWTDATKLCVVTSVLIDGIAGSGTAFVAGFGKLDLVVARAYTVAGSGGTPYNTTGNNGKARTSMATSIVNDIRIASTGALTAGTRTLDAVPVGQYVFAVGTTASVTYAGRFDLMKANGENEHPIVLAAQEGFIVRATVPATGTWQFGLTVTWTEVTAY